MGRRNSRSGTVEYRSVALGDTQVDAGKLNGVGIRFSSPTVIGDLAADGFREEFAAGVFTKTLQERDTVLLDNHDPARPIARKSAGTLRLDQTATDLRWDADPVDTSYARDAAANIKAGNYGGCSVGFRSIKEDWYDADGNPSNAAVGVRRVVREADLPELSVVTFPAYTDTSVSARDVVSAARESRAAKATYSDLDTCAECGATHQYGAYCADCGEPMGVAKSPDKFCTSCGAELGGNRDEHVCAEVREKYSADDKKKMLASGQAMKNAKGDPSYPIGDEEDLDKAIHAVGRGGSDHDGIRKHIIAQAKKLGLSSKIPDNWNADGSLKEEDSAALGTESRDDPDGKEFAAIDAAVDYLQADEPDTANALKVLLACRPRNAEIPKPEVSTSGIDIRSYRLRVTKLQEVL